ncbi:MAG: monovalent cation/H(+) antiporter subunit G [Tepidimonas fonticaldi]|nr:monovalent cation/H(+) antiporter subunit G [Tepidimonas fonticaldi]
MSGLGASLLGGGAVLLVIAAWGVVALPDALSRQHAATKAGTLAVALVCAGAAFAVAESSWTWRLLLIIGFLLATLPVASNLLARAAVREAGQEADAERAPVVGGDAGPTAPGSLSPGRD